MVLMVCKLCLIVNGPIRINIAFPFALRKCYETNEPFVYAITLSANRNESF